MIPFNKPWLSGREAEYLAQSLATAKLCGDGDFSRRCEAFMEERFGARKVLLTTSCTSALELAALLLDVGPGDEVILPSFTFVSTANAFLLRGAELRFVDIQPDTLNIDPARVSEAVTKRTRVIVPVHYAGIGCGMAALTVLARDRGVAIVEDAAQGVDATYKGRHLGTIGDLGAYSFHETKNFVCGEGGALVINREDLIERAQVLREKGTNRSAFLRGQVDKYTWVDVGSSFLPADPLAAVLLAQLEAMEAITERRRAAHDFYHQALEPLEARGWLRRPVIPDNCQTNFHMYYLLVEDLAVRTDLIAHLKQDGVQAAFHYVPLHSSPKGRSLGGSQGPLPVTERIADQLVRLPMHACLTEDDLARVAQSVIRFFNARPGRTQSAERCAGDQLLQTPVHNCIP
jgi:dTDP-4-amino-4,6-dideoxygalactose transaminase